MCTMKLNQLTPEQIAELAPRVPTSRATLRQIATGRRGVSALKAIAIEHAAAEIGLDLRREVMNSGCKVCEFAKACRQMQRTTRK